MRVRDKLVFGKNNRNTINYEIKGIIKIIYSRW